MVALTCTTYPVPYTMPAVYVQTSIDMYPSSVYAHEAAYMTLATRSSLLYSNLVTLLVHDWPEYYNTCILIPYTVSYVYRYILYIYIYKYKLANASLSHDNTEKSALNFLPPNNIIITFTLYCSLIYLVLSRSIKITLPHCSLFLISFSKSQSN